MKVTIRPVRLCPKLSYTVKWPLTIGSVRSRRFNITVWKCNDTARTPEGTRLHFCLWQKLWFGSVQPSPPTCPRQVGFYSSSPTAQQKYGVGFCLPHIFGTPEGTRTPNPRNRNPMLYPLSHRRVLWHYSNLSWFCKEVKIKKFPRFLPQTTEKGCFPGIVVV